MKSTGECLGIARNFNEALYKAFAGAGVKLPKHKKLLLSVNDHDKPEVVPIAEGFKNLGYKIYATHGTADYLKEHGVETEKVNKLNEESPNFMDLILSHEMDLVIDTPTAGTDGFLIRRYAIETGVTCITALDTAKALLLSLENHDTRELEPVNIAQME